MGTPLGPEYIPYTYMDPLGQAFASTHLSLLHAMELRRQLRGAAAPFASRFCQGDLVPGPLHLLDRSGFRV